MLFWILAAFITVAVAIVLLVPLARRSGGDADAVDFDVEVYRDQLREIDRDVSGDLISEDEAEFARAEVGRRLIKASKQSERRSGLSGSAALYGRIAVIVGLPLLSLVGYLATGNPGMPSQPLAARQFAPPVTGEDQDLQALVAQAEAHLANNPDDGRGWDVLAPIYFRLERLGEAEIAFRNAIRLLGSSPARQAGLGQVLYARAGGIVTADAQAAFQAVLDAEPDNPFASYFMALAVAQEGRTDEAYDAFSEIAERSPPDAPWMQAVRFQMQRLRGPDAGDVEAAMALTEQERRDMIEGMVAGLDARLQEDPSDLDGWLRLIRSYMVLGETQQATDAFENALRAFPEESGQRQALVELAVALGLDTTEMTE